MEIFPNIDLKDGAVVRLTQGNYNRVDVYANDPAEVARQYIAKGAKNLHMVDLDGAREGRIVNSGAVREIVALGGLFVQLGGGIRDEERIVHYLDMGVNRVILGTAAVENFPFTCRMVEKYGSKIAVGVDVREGKVAVKGWQETSSLDSIELCRRLEAAGVSTVVHTDISRDGTMKGVNLDLYRRLKSEVGLNIIAAGGVSAMEDVEELKKLGVYGAVLGKALFTGALKLEEVLARC